MSSTTVQRTLKKEQKSNPAAIAAASKTWNVTNDTNIDLVAIDAFLSDPTSTDELYQRSLNLLSAPGGQQLVKAGETKTISLSEVHTGSDGKAVDYTIILARADNLFPVKIVELPVSDSNESFPAATATAEDAGLMKKAEMFQQTITAFPASEMATAFAAVLASPDEQKIHAFFTSYPQYTAINLDKVVAVQTYYNRYGFVWAGYAVAQLYNLYTSDGTTKRNLGTVSINSQVTLPVTNLDAPAGFTATYTDANHRNTILHYSNGQFADDVDSSSPKICLQGLFFLKSELTGVDTDNKLIPKLYGVVNGAEAVGYADKDFADGGKPGKPFIDSLLHPQSISDGLKLAGMIVAALAAIAVLAVTARFIVKAVKNHLNPSPEEIRRRARQKAQEIVNKMDPELKRKLRIPDDLATATADIKKRAGENLLKDSRRKLGDIMTKQLDTCRKLLEYGNTTSLQGILEKTEHNLDTLPEADPTAMDLGQRMSGYMGDVTENAKLLNDRVKALGKKISKGNADTIAEAKRTADDLTKRVTESEKIRETFEEDEIPEIIED